MKKEVKYLGYKLSEEGISVGEERVECVAALTTPKDKTELRAYLGALQGVRRFIPRFAEITRPLTRLTAKGEFTWGREP